jgi:predicted ATPase
MFSQINFSKEKYPRYKTLGPTKENILGNLSKINILIGQNNSGKSRFIRTLFADDDFTFIYSHKDISGLARMISEVEMEISKHLGNLRVKDLDEILSRIQKINTTLELLIGKMCKKTFNHLETTSNN